ncbi:hypothetical protein ACFLTI_01715 [Bacteroidota bacterium]
MENQDIKKNIIETINVKSEIKQKVYDRTKDSFEILKNILKKIVVEYNKEISSPDERVKFNYKDNGPFEAELKVSGDLLIFNMHSNVFEFNREHEIWKTGFVKKDVLNSYVGIINIYNFLADSFKYNRFDDVGYLIGRIFINKDGYFFVEGKRQLGHSLKTFGEETLNKKFLEAIINIAVKYALDFDLLVPPYDQIIVASVGQIHEKINHSRLKTGKRLGFKFQSDDIADK